MFYAWAIVHIIINNYIIIFPWENIPSDFFAFKAPGNSINYDSLLFLWK